MIRANKDPAKVRTLKKSATNDERILAHEQDADSLWAWSLGKHPKGEILTAEKQARDHMIAAHALRALALMDHQVSEIGTSGSVGPIEPTWDSVKNAMNQAHLAPVYLPDGSVLLVDEDGVPKQLPVNERASIVAGQRLVGDVVFIPKEFVRTVMGE